MIQGKKISMIAFVVSTIFLLASTSAVAEYSQIQNKVDDKQDSGQKSQPDTASKKKNDEDKSTQSSSDKSDRTTTAPSGMDKKNDSETKKKGNY